MAVCRHPRSRSTIEAQSKKRDERERRMARKESKAERENNSRDGDVTEKAQLNCASIGRSLVRGYTVTSSTRGSSRDLPYVIFRCLPAPTDGVCGRREMTELRTARAERRRVSCHSSRSRCAMSKSRSHTAAAARAKRSAASEIGECPVVEVTVDVEQKTRETRRSLDACSRGVVTSSCLPRASCACFLSCRARETKETH